MSVIIYQTSWSNILEDFHFMPSPQKPETLPLIASSLLHFMKT
jgi:hypothetical protein